MEKNQELISFLQKQARKSNQRIKESISRLLHSISLCPLVLDLEDSLDLIGVNDDTEPLLNEFFSKDTDNYCPKEGTMSRKMLLALHNSHPDPLYKADILKAMDFRPPPQTLRQKKFFGPWASMKTLIVHGLVNKSKERLAKYSLTDKGVKLSNDLFGSRLPDRDINTSIRLYVSKNEIQCRVSFDVSDALRRTRLPWSEKVIPVGSIWFVKNNMIYDFLIQFVSLTLANDESTRRKISGVPFTKRVFLLPSKENPLTSAEVKLKLNSEYNIEMVFADSVPSIALYIRGIAQILESTNKFLGTFDEVVQMCSEHKYAMTINNVWKEQLKLVPGMGPSVAANIAAIYQTPHQLIASLEQSRNPQEKFNDDVVHRWGRKPSQKATSTIINLFTENTQ